MSFIPPCNRACIVSAKRRVNSEAFNAAGVSTVTVSQSQSQSCVTRRKFTNLVSVGHWPGVGVPEVPGVAKKYNNKQRTG